MQRLVVPKPPPAEIVELERLLSKHREVKPTERAAFVKTVNTILDQTNYCFQLAPDGALSRKLYFNRETSRDGDILFRTTAGKSRGFVDAKFTLIPYIRKYGGKSVT